MNFPADEFDDIDARPDLVPLVGQWNSLGLACCDHDTGHNLRLLRFESSQAKGDVVMDEVSHHEVVSANFVAIRLRIGLEDLSECSPKSDAPLGFDPTIVDANRFDLHDAARFVDDEGELAAFLVIDPPCEGNSVARTAADAGDASATAATAGSTWGSRTARATEIRVNTHLPATATGV
jgi:hypothetical protein